MHKFFIAAFAINKHSVSKLHAAFHMLAADDDEDDDITFPTIIHAYVLLFDDHMIMATNKVYEATTMDNVAFPKNAISVYREAYTDPKLLIKFHHVRGSVEMYAKPTKSGKYWTVLVSRCVLYPSMPSNTYKYD